MIDEAVQLGSEPVSPRAAARPTTGTIVLLTRLARAVYLRIRLRPGRDEPAEHGGARYLADHPGVSQQVMTEMLSMDSNTGVLVLNDLEDLEFVEYVGTLPTGGGTSSTSRTPACRRSRRPSWRREALRTRS